MTQPNIIFPFLIFINTNSNIFSNLQNIHIIPLVILFTNFLIISRILLFQIHYYIPLFIFVYFIL